MHKPELKKRPPAQPGFEVHLKATSSPGGEEPSPSWWPLLSSPFGACWGLDCFLPLRGPGRLSLPSLPPTASHARARFVFPDFFPPAPPPKRKQLRVRPSFHRAREEKERSGESLFSCPGPGRVLRGCGRAPHPNPDLWRRKTGGLAPPEFMTKPGDHLCFL